MTKDFKTLLAYAHTKKQVEAIEACIAAGSIMGAAKLLNVKRQTIQAAVSKCERHMVREDLGLPARYVPDGHTVVGVSTLARTEDGEPQWIKTKADAQEQKRLLEEMREGFKDTLPKAKPVAASKTKKNDDIVNLHILTDYHLGMNAWNEQCGEDWDIKIAEELLINWFRYSIAAAPQARVGILGQLGDFLHYDGIEPVTPKSRHVLDVDTRFQKVVRVAIRSLRQIVAMMLKKYDTVHVIMADANHDEASSAWLREIFASFYKDDPRVSIDDGADSYYCYEHGKTSLFFHHGHKRKPNAIDNVFVSKFRDVFGRTRYSYAHTGHMHHDMKLETNLMTVEQHRTMAAKDAYASTGGWMSDRSAAVISYHREYGEVGRLNVTPEMVG